jgi:hypothetical protein
MGEHCDLCGKKVYTVYGYVCDDEEGAVEHECEADQEMLDRTYSGGDDVQ